MRRFSVDRFLLWTLLLVLLVLVGTSATQAATSHAPLAIDVERYRFEIELTDADDVLRGVTDIAFSVREGSAAPSQLRFDLVSADTDPEDRDRGMTVDQVWLLDSLGGAAPMPWVHSEDQLLLTLDAAQWSSAVGARIQYHGIPRDGLVISNDRHGQRTFFGDNWPNRARHWLPVVDHPADKAFATFAVTAPGEYQVISVGERVSERDLGDGRRETVWASGHPLPTKVMVIGVAKFFVDYRGSVRGVPIESWIFAGDYPDSVGAFDETKAIVEFFVDRLGPFPYTKLANVQSKTRFGGMENASAIFYSEAAVARGADEGLVAHEIAHQWFGDSVSEASWPDVWLSEGFATYMTALYLEWRYGSERLEETLRRARRRVLDLAQREPAPVIPEQVDDLMNLLSANSYQKGAWVLHMLRRELGNDVFWQGLRQYYAQYRDGNATTAQFRRVMEETHALLRNGEGDDGGDIDLTWFFDQWLSRPGHPIVEVTVEIPSSAAANSVRLRGRQTPFAVGAQPFKFSLDVDLIAADGSAERTTIEFDGWTTEAVLETTGVPVSVVLDPDAWLLFSPVDEPDSD